MKDGKYTSEFQLTAVLTAFFALLVGYGAITQQQSDLWMALAVAVMPILPMFYAAARTWLKSWQPNEIELTAEIEPFEFEAIDAGHEQWSE